MIRWLALLLIIACQSIEQPLMVVRWVTDGDTIVVEDGSDHGLKVRLIGIDAPESRDFKGRKEEPLGKEATAVLVDLIEQGPVRLEYDLEEFDRFGRTLAYVYTEDGRMLNEEMIRMGYAECMTIQPNTRYAERFKEAEQLARTQGLGIWK